MSNGAAFFLASLVTGWRFLCGTSALRGTLVFGTSAAFTAAFAPGSVGSAVSPFDATLRAPFGGVAFAVAVFGDAALGVEATDRLREVLAAFLGGAVFLPESLPGTDVFGFGAERFFSGIPIMVTPPRQSAKVPRCQRASAPKWLPALAGSH
jgi:hypothetical protein